MFSSTPMSRHLQQPLPAARRPGAAEQRWERGQRRAPARHGQARTTPLRAGYPRFLLLAGQRFPRKGLRPVAQRALRTDDDALSLGGPAGRSAMERSPSGLNRERKDFSAERMEKLREECLSCKNAHWPHPAQRGVRRGNENAEVLFIGEARRKRGLQGSLSWAAAASCSTTNSPHRPGPPQQHLYRHIDKCRPPHHPTPGHRQTAASAIGKTDRADRPQAIVCLGSSAAMRIIKPDFKDQPGNGQWFPVGSGRPRPCIPRRAPPRPPPPSRTFEDLKGLRPKFSVCFRTN
jgi:uracil-DNA glycosylase